MYKCNRFLLCVLCVAIISSWIPCLDAQDITANKKASFQLTSFFAGCLYPVPDGDQGRLIDIEGNLVDDTVYDQYVQPFDNSFRYGQYEEIEFFSDRNQSVISDYHDEYRYYLSLTEVNSELVPWKDVVWPWENDLTLQEQRVDVLKTLARNNAKVVFDRERGRLIELTFDSGGMAEMFPDTGRRADFISADDVLLLHVIDAFPELRYIRILYMGPGITNESITELPRLKYLKKLEFSPVSRYYCNITDAAMSSIAQCKNLEFLKISNMHITDKGIEALSSHVGIVCLSLRFLDLSPKCFIPIAKLPNIRHLSVTPYVAISYDQETLDAITSLNGRLEYLHVSILAPDILYAVCQIKSLRGGGIMIFHGQLHKYSEFSFSSPPISYESLVQSMEIQEMENNFIGHRVPIDWNRFKNYQPKEN